MLPNLRGNKFGIASRDLGSFLSQALSAFYTSDSVPSTADLLLELADAKRCEAASLWEWAWAVFGFPAPCREMRAYVLALACRLHLKNSSFLD